MTNHDPLRWSLAGWAFAGTVALALLAPPDAAASPAAFTFAPPNPGFIPALLGGNPLNDPEAPATPFAMEEYVLAARTDAERLEREATATTASAHRDVQQADNYVLCVVLFAASLFFAGISTRLRSAGAQLSILGLGYVVFLGALGWMLTYPVSFAT